MVRFGIDPGMAMAVALSALALISEAQAELIAVKWSSDGKFDRTQSIAPGKFAEICEPLAKGTVVMWQFKASGPLNFNIHFHQGKEVVFPEKKDGVSDLQGTLVAQGKEDYCWMWTNKGEAVSSIRVLLAKPTAAR